jgi:hypothetical protein
MIPSSWYYWFAICVFSVVLFCIFIGENPGIGVMVSGTIIAGISAVIGIARDASKKDVE